MKNMYCLGSTIVVCLAATATTSQAALFSDDFDSIPSPITATASGTVNGYKILFDPTVLGAEDFKVVFGFDYSTISYPVSIPSAPNSVGGTTKGLFVTANKADASAVIAGVNLFPVGQSFSGDFALKFDVWINWTNLATSTEYALFGINHSGILTNRIGKGGSDGVFFAMDGDGGASATSTGSRDFSIFSGRGNGPIPLLLTTNNTAFSQRIGDRFDNADSGASALFLSKPIYGGTPAGSPGLGWVSGEVDQVGNQITWSLNGTVIAQFVNTNGFNSGNIMLGYNDAFGSIGDTNNFAIFDNIRVLAIPEPSMWVFVEVLCGVLAAAFVRSRQ